MFKPMQINTLRCFEEQGLQTSVRHQTA